MYIHISTHFKCTYREAQARVREDDEIIEALGRYTSKLQLSLKIINSAHAADV